MPDYNNETGECLWEQPEDYKEINYSLLMMMAKNSKSELWASLLVQKTWRAKKARGDVRTVRAEQAAEGSDELWTPVLDPGSGEYYYYNNETGDTTWDKPAELMTDEEKAAKAEEPAPEELPEWAKVYDPSSEDYYYYNNFTGECVWEQPDGYKEINYSLLMMMAKGTKSELWAAILVQKTWRAKKARGDVRAERGAQSGGTGWEEIMDPSCEMPYYCPCPAC